MKKRLVDADKLMERAKMNSVLVTVEHDHHDYGLTLGTLNKIVKECELPAAQPKRTDKRTETHACDLISRAEAIDAICKSECGSGFCGIPCPEVNALKALPSAQPGRKKGKWIYGEDEYGIDGYHCDKCGFFVPWDYAHKFINYIEDYNFCPNCGADMREGGKK